jgi:hypothetical protein
MKLEFESKFSSLIQENNELKVSVKNLKSELKELSKKFEISQVKFILFLGSIHSFLFQVFSSFLLIHLH